MQVKESKVKESKVKKRDIPPHLADIWPDFVAMRKQIRKPMTDKAQSLAVKKLADMTEDPAEQVEIVEQSLMNSWQGFFPLKQEHKKLSYREEKAKHECERSSAPVPDFI
jgi:hypothetical protein